MRSMKWCTDIYIHTHTHSIDWNAWRHWSWPLERNTRCFVTSLPVQRDLFASPGELYVCSCLCPGRQPDVSLHFCQLTLLNTPGSHGVCSAFLIWQCVVIIGKTWVSPKGAENQVGTANRTQSQCVPIHCTNVYCVNSQYSLMPFLARVHNLLSSYPHK